MKSLRVNTGCLSYANASIMPALGTRAGGEVMSGTGIYNGKDIMVLGQQLADDPDTHAQAALTQYLRPSP
jgi:hypothetical protein